MSIESTVMAWDTALRASEWETARSLLTEDALYTSALAAIP
jgi:ketosteroid isomerase-like protein